MKKQYSIPDSAPQEFFEEFPEIHPIVLQLLYQRNIRTAKDIDHFLYPDYERDQYDPFLFQDMKKVVQRILEAKAKKQSVVVYGDYDADGVCASTVMYSALQHIGITNIRIYLPHRDTEGYGLNSKAIQAFIEEKVDLIITVDCGISNVAEVAEASQSGIDVIVTDHHVEPPELPNAAYAIVNPQIKQDTYPFAMLAGVGVAFKVAQAIGRTLQLGDGYEKWLLDLVAISTITDCMPLVDENRTFVKYGLVVLNKTRRLGLQQLIAATHSENAVLNTTSIAYRLGPCINAAGRIDHANMAVALLKAENKEDALQYTDQLRATNTSRQQQTEKMFNEARELASHQAQQPIIYVCGNDWPLGLVGLVAGKLVSAFRKPAFVMTKHQGKISGSGRSVEGLNMIEQLQQMKSLFEKYGGHAMACGFTLESANQTEFERQFTNLATPILQVLPTEPTIAVDARLKLQDINWDLLNHLTLMEPFGEGNPEPIFLLENVQIKDFQIVGKNNQHLRFLLEDNNITRKAIAFGWGKIANKLTLDLPITATCTLGINEWNNNREIQMALQYIDVE